ncbi:hypothetical protein GQR58_030715 [Nymphon striatum]|nr:hypothetical protein GQR58_030715 [Nymphon striatum]
MALPHWPVVPTPDSDVWSDPSRRLEEDIKYFPDMVAYMDKAVGKLIDGLEALKLREKTIVIFYSDNGTDQKVVSDGQIKGGKATPSANRHSSASDCELSGEELSPTRSNPTGLLFFTWPVVPMVAAWFAKAIDWFPVTDKTRKGLYLGAIIPGFLLCAFFYLSPIIFGMAGAAGHKADPNRRLIGGKAFGEQVQEVRKNIPGWEEAFVATSGHRYNASYLAFWLPDRPRVYSLFKTHKVSQYEVWPGAFEDNGVGKNGVIVQQGHIDKPQVTNAFESVEAVGQIRFNMVGELAYTPSLMPAI